MLLNIKNAKFLEQMTVLRKNGTWLNNGEIVRQAVDDLFYKRLLLESGKLPTGNKKQNMKTTKVEEGKLICERLEGVIDGENCTYTNYCTVSGGVETYSATIPLEDLSEENIKNQHV